MSLPWPKLRIFANVPFVSASAIMSTKLTVSNLPNFRKSTLALHRINSMVNGNNETSQSTNHDGFDDLRHFIKAGGEFSKELASTLADRAELEANYAKGLAKMAAKLFKVSYEISAGQYSNFSKFFRTCVFPMSTRLFFSVLFWFFSWRQISKFLISLLPKNLIIVARMKTM